MCGIVGYTGFRTNAYPLLIKGLKRLEYRGYDSSGIALAFPGNPIACFKKVGKIKALEEFVGVRAPEASAGIAHTRWATNGEPSDLNSHPHTGCREEIYIVHNGIIDNNRTLREYLIREGHTISSDTDTELLVHLIEETPTDDPPEERVRKALQFVDGTYGIIVMFGSHPEQLIAARKGSPLCLGIGEGEYFVSSDPTGFVEHTRNVVFLEDYQLAIIRPDGYTVKKMTENGAEVVDPRVEEIALEISQIELGTFDHYMLKEIYDQPESLKRGMSGRVTGSEIVLGGIREHLNDLLKAPLVVFLACGTSWHAGLIGEVYFEEIAGIPSEVKYASELSQLMRPAFPQGTVFIAISQSGETKDTDLAIEKMQELGYLVLGVVNSEASTIARRVAGGVFIHAGPEIGVASTKAFTSQVLTLLMLAFLLGSRNKFIQHEFAPDWPQRFLAELHALPEKVQKILDNTDPIREVAIEFAKKRNFLFLGRGVNFPTALEGALKLKEISYIHAEGYPAAEMKHGPIALIDTNMPSVVIAPQNDNAYAKVCANIGEVVTRKGLVIAVATEGDTQIRKLAERVLYVPNSSYFLTTILSVIPLQLLAYYTAVERKLDVDKPRNLAKSVTVH